MIISKYKSLLENIKAIFANAADSFIFATPNHFARVAKLVDALPSGGSVRKDVLVRIQSRARALIIIRAFLCSYFFFRFVNYHLTCELCKLITATCNSSVYHPSHLYETLKVITFKKNKMNSKQILRIVSLAVVIAIAAPASAAVIDPVLSQTNSTEKTESLRGQQLMQRLEEIKAMDKSELSRLEKKSLRKEVTSIKKEMKTMSGGVYLSVGAIIIVILLLILLL